MKVNIRKIVPLISLQNSGKNILLNILYKTNIENNFALAGNKFINILRYNPEIK